MLFYFIDYSNRASLIMISFNSGVNTEVVLEIFSRILIGMSKSDFHQSDTARLMKISNMDTSQSFAMYTVMKFDCIYGQVEINHSTMSKMTVNLLSVPVQEQMDDEIRKSFTCQISEEKNADDYAAIMKIVQTMGQQSPESFRFYDEHGADYPDVVMQVSFDVCHTRDKTFADLFINLIGRALGFITLVEADYLCDLFGMSPYPIHREKVSQYFAAQFDNFFDTLKFHKHTVDNQFFFNDVDNFVHYITSKDEVIKGIVSRSQNHMFLFAKDTDTGIIKIWNTMKINDPIKLEMFYEVENSVFDGVRYMSSMLFSKHGQKYYYPCEFEAPYYRKKPETLIDDFDSDDTTSQLIYSSDNGFYSEQNLKFDPCISDFDFAVEVIADEYIVESIIINNSDSDIDYRSPTYVIRKLLYDNTLLKDRISALSYVFARLGHGYYWEEGGIVNGSNFIELLEYHEYEEQVKPISIDIFFSGDACLLSHRPDDISQEWISVIREFVGYYKEWVDTHPDKASAEYLGARIRLNELVTI